MLFTLKKYIGGMMLPLPLLLLLIALGLALIWFSRFQKSGKSLVTVGWLALLLLSLQPVADGLLRPIENTPDMAGKSEGGLYRGAGRRVYLGSELGAQLEPDQQQPAAPERGDPPVAGQSWIEDDLHGRCGKNQPGQYR